MLRVYVLESSHARFQTDPLPKPLSCRRGQSPSNRDPSITWLTRSSPPPNYWSPTPHLWARRNVAGWCRLGSRLLRDTGRVGGAGRGGSPGAGQADAVHGAELEDVAAADVQGDAGAAHAGPVGDAVVGRDAVLGVV